MVRERTVTRRRQMHDLNKITRNKVSTMKETSGEEHFCNKRTKVKNRTRAAVCGIHLVRVNYAWMAETAAM
jgi:hypothetical protein